MNDIPVLLYYSHPPVFIGDIAILYGTQTVIKRCEHRTGLAVLGNHVTPALLHIVNAADGRNHGLRTSIQPFRIGRAGFVQR